MIGSAQSFIRTTTVDLSKRAVYIQKMELPSSQEVRDMIDEVNDFIQAGFHNIDNGAGKSHIFNK